MKLKLPKGNFILTNISKHVLIPCLLDFVRTAAVVFSQNDYLVRVDMNDLLLRLDVNNEDHKLFANILLENFFLILSDDSLFEFMYTSTAGHRLKV